LASKNEFLQEQRDEEFLDSEIQEIQSKNEVQWKQYKLHGWHELVEGSR
jgi:hypothetical protein